MKHVIMSLVAMMLPAVGAQAQVKIAAEGQEYVINSVSDATSDAGTVSYEWYRNGELIPACTTATCTVPANLCYGHNVEFKRKAVTTDCMSEEQWAPTTIVVTFKCGDGHGTVVGGLCWADRNVGEPGAFFTTVAISPGVYAGGYFYKWNSNKPWPYGNTAVADWPQGNQDVSMTWTVRPNPCPTGWRLPTAAEFQALIATGSNWISSVGNNGFSAKGVTFGPNANNCSYGQLYDCVYFPADGFRDIGSGDNYVLSYMGCYWSSNTTVYPNGGVADICGHALQFYVTNEFYIECREKGNACTIRCVQ